MSTQKKKSGKTLKKFLLVQAFIRTKCIWKISQLKFKLMKNEEKSNVARHGTMIKLRAN